MTTHRPTSYRPRPRHRALGPLLLTGLLAGCGGACGGPAPGPAPADAPTGLVPAPPPGPSCRNTVAAASQGEPLPRLAVGDRAPDVPLLDTQGRPHQLSELLATGRPVLVATGSLTCPVYRKRAPALRRLAERYADRLHTVLVYTIEAHPQHDPSPYTGAPWPLRFSDRDLATTEAERLDRARQVRLGPHVRVATDPLSDAHGHDPLWCTWGSVPHGAWLIGPDGVVRAVHDWLDAKSMAGSVEALLAD